MGFPLNNITLLFHNLCAFCLIYKKVYNLQQHIHSNSPQPMYTGLTSKIHLLWAVAFWYLGIQGYCEKYLIHPKFIKLIIRSHCPVWICWQFFLTQFIWKTFCISFALIIISPPHSMSALTTALFTFSKAFLSVNCLFQMNSYMIWSMLFRTSTSRLISCIIYAKFDSKTVFANSVFPIIDKFRSSHCLMVSSVWFNLASKLFFLN